jgi:lipoprotein NlpI
MEPSKQQDRGATNLSAAYPKPLESHAWLGLLLHVVGRHNEELDEIRRAIELDPLFPILVNNRALALFETGKEKEAFDLLM